MGRVLQRAEIDRKEGKMTDLEQRALDALHQAFCRLRSLVKRPLNDAGRQHLFLIADAAHNIPDALSGNADYRENLESDVLLLEELLSESYGIAEGRYLAQQEA
jgi:hypothetical protein